MNDCGVEPAVGQQLLREQHVLAGIRRTVLDQDALPRYAHAYGDGRELIGFGFGPELAGDRAEAAGEDEEWGPAVEEELRSPLGDRRVVAAEHQDGVRSRQLVAEVMVGPDGLDECLDLRRHAFTERRRARARSPGRRSP